MVVPEGSDESGDSEDDDDDGGDDDHGHDHEDANDNVFSVRRARTLERVMEHGDDILVWVESSSSGDELDPLDETSSDDDETLGPADLEIGNDGRGEYVKVPIGDIRRASHERIVLSEAFVARGGVYPLYGSRKVIR